ncbi:YbaN family protein [Curvibacter sp. CHRR-16]|uniref:YbaN family protein n=1 Tax=Curvibacter sp. CHRR-16 TaxID=2835872 RepID=UPI001BDA3F3E|nr:YbaN family protein [Curvibacter sp. CHRR-16]MBT0570720.1 YbaN family protein [Curvibacter sp. CHRR-16]
MDAKASLNPNMEAAPVLATRWRIAWMILAWVSLAIGLVAILIPGLPTTEFVLLSAYAASKSSPRFHAWLCQHRVFGPMIRNWHSGKLIARTTKLSASLMMSACFVLMAVWVPHRWLVVLAGLCMTAGAVWMWRRPEPTSAVSD